MKVVSKRHMEIRIADDKGNSVEVEFEKDDVWATTIVNDRAIMRRDGIILNVPAKQFDKRFREVK